MQIMRPIVITKQKFEGNKFKLIISFVTNHELNLGDMAVFTVDNHGSYTKLLGIIREISVTKDGNMRQYLNNAEIEGEQSQEEYMINYLMKDIVDINLGFDKDFNNIGFEENNNEQD